MDTRTGLTSEQAAEGLEKWGRNEIAAQQKNTLLKVFLSQFNNALVLMLIGATILSFGVGENIDGLLIMAIVLMNALLGTVQEFKAEQALAKLKEIATTLSRVIRNGKEEEIDARLLTVGDIVILEEGTKIPADGEIVEGNNLEVNEAILTGESMPVTRDREVSGGTVVTRGRVKYKITQVGMATRFGSIAKDLARVKEEPSPLQKKLKKLSVGMLVLGVVAAIFLTIYEGILSGISLAVAVIPEGLPAVMAVTLAFGVARMARNKAVVRKMTAVESLGAVTLIATDKTGTITKNLMEVAEEKIVDKEKMMMAAALCNTSTLVIRGGDEVEVIGDQTEGALMKWAERESGNLPAGRQGVEELKRSSKILGEWLFESGTRMMSIAVKQVDGKSYVYSKGSVDKILEKCRGIPEKELKKIWLEHDRMAKSGLRIIGAAYKEYRGEKKREQVENQLIWAGMVGIADPIREETAEVVKRAKAAGIRVMMITGDNELTASSVGRQAGILQAGEDILTGGQVDALDDAELSRHLRHVSVFARMRPEQKLRLVSLMQKAGFVTAMTGDGVNDAPALKQADVGVAMGKNGTDVAREAADVVLLDDNLATLVVAIESGRGIIDALLKTIKYLLVTNLGEVMVILSGVVLKGVVLLAPAQILWINLVTDGLPALAMSTQTGSQGLMGQKTPTGFLKLSDWTQIIAGGSVLAGISFWSWTIWGEMGMFNVLVWGQLIIALVINGKRINKFLVLAVVASGILQLLAGKYWIVN